MTQRNRRTPEQLAAYHQAKANAARAKAAKQARSFETTAKIILGSALLKSTLAADYVVLKGPKTLAYFDALKHLLGAHVSEADLARIEQWWQMNNLPESAVDLPEGKGARLVIS